MTPKGSLTLQRLGKTQQRLTDHIKWWKHLQKQGFESCTDMAIHATPPGEDRLQLNANGILKVIENLRARVPEVSVEVSTDDTPPSTKH